MINLLVQNFRNIRQARLDDPTGLSVIVGKNEAGKSSLAGSIEFVMTGSAFGCKGKDIESLVHSGETRMKVDLEVGGVTASRTRASGAALKDVAARLGVDATIVPLLFNQGLCLNASGKMMRAFLDTLADAPLDLATALKEHADLLPLLNLAKLAGAITPKQVSDYATRQRAAAQPPAAPVKPTVERPDDTSIDALQANIDSLTASSTARSAEVRAVNAELDILKRCIGFTAAVAAYDLRVANLPADALNEKRATVTTMSTLSTTPVDEIAATLESCGHGDVAKQFADLQKQVQGLIAAASATLTANPIPESVGVRPALREETQVVYDRQPKKDATSIQETIDARTAWLATETPAVAAISSDLEVKRASIRTLTEARASWASYETGAAGHEMLVKQVDEKWNAWDALITKIAGLQHDRQQTGAQQFIAVVAEFGKSVLAGRELTFSEAGEILLGGASTNLLSASTQWRVAVCVMAAIATHAKSPLLAIDGGDILDDENRVAMMKFLIKAIVPHFKHVILLSTVRGKLCDEKVLPASIPGRKWLMEEGRLTPCTNA